jgi:hypothetical protein
MIAPRRFWFLLALIIVGTIGILFLCDTLLPESDALSQFTLVCVGTFTLINILAYTAAKRAVRSKSKYRFIQLIMVLILCKMIICIGLVVAHVKINNPDSKLFVLPFLLIYLIFTFFEIYVLEKLARTTDTTATQQQ